MPKLTRKLIESDAALAECCDQIVQKQISQKTLVVGFDTETTGLDPRRSKLRLVQIAVEDLGTTFLIDCFKIQNFGPLKSVLMNYDIAKLCFNADFDTTFVIHNFGVYISYPLDLFLAALLLREYEGALTIKKGDFTLQTCLERECNIKISKEQQVSNWDAPVLTEEQLEYAAQDVEWLYELADVLVERILFHGMDEAFMTENSCILATALMGYEGIYADPVLLKELQDEIDQKRHDATVKIGKYPEFSNMQPALFSDGPAEAINLGSHVQVWEAFKKRWGVELKDQYEKNTTSGGVLLKYRDRDPELVDLFVDRASLKTASDHAKAFGESIDSITGRIHSDFRQLGSPQHRYASSRPILLNVERPDSYGPGVPKEDSIMRSKRDFRSCFKPGPGRKFVISDYSQLQLRAIAQESGDPVMLKAYLNGLDLHRQTAEVILGKPEAQVSKAERYLAKTTNFAVAFECGPERLRETFLKGLGINKTYEECDLFIKRYFKRYRGVKIYHNLQHKKAEREGKVQVRGGRATLFKEGAVPKGEAVNFVAALLEVSGAKKALGRLARIFWNKPYWARIVLSPFDEIVVECDEAAAPEVAVILEKEMVNCMKEYIWKVPVIAETKIADSWGG